ncbi:uncharacterized protein VTP21DRAFT_6014 [Calcarisporiella thermophila]|uniref:uncharacterized protein n=1 Tax=Calcarisporiella thermophila TaxID=911321 RepID=UPI0037424EE7
MIEKGFPAVFTRPCILSLINELGVVVAVAAETNPKMIVTQVWTRLVECDGVVDSQLTINVRLAPRGPVLDHYQALARVLGLHLGALAGEEHALPLPGDQGDCFPAPLEDLNGAMGIFRPELER